MYYFLHACVLSLFSRVQLCVTPWTIAHQAPLSMGFSRQEYWSSLPFPYSGRLPNPGIKHGSPALQVDSLLLSHLGSPLFWLKSNKIRVLVNLLILFSLLQCRKIHAELESLLKNANMWVYNYLWNSNSVNWLSQISLIKKNRFTSNVILG